MYQEREVQYFELANNNGGNGCGYCYQKSNEDITCKYKAKEKFSIFEINLHFILKASRV